MMTFILYDAQINKVQRKLCVLTLNYKQGIDGSTSKPALRQDPGYIVEITYIDIAPYLGAFGAYLMAQ